MALGVPILKHFRVLMLHICHYFFLNIDLLLQLLLEFCKFNFHKCNHVYKYFKLILCTYSHAHDSGHKCLICHKAVGWNL